MALSRVELNVHPFGLGGGTVLSGSVSASFTDVFQYYPIINTTAALRIAMPQNNALGISGSATLSTSASLNSQTYNAGVAVYGPITQVTQSSGIAIVYSGVVTADGGYRL